MGKFLIKKVFLEKSKSDINFDADGYMATGWRWIRGTDGLERCYYFKEQSDGTRGAMLCGATTPDGWQVDGNGVWTVGGVPQVRQPVS